jgi:hypothetical protein
MGETISEDRKEIEALKNLYGEGIRFMTDGFTRLTDGYT